MILFFAASSGELFEAKRRGENTAALSTVSPLTREPLSEMRSASSREAADAQIISIINPKTRRNPRVLRRGLQNVTFVGAWFDQTVLKVTDCSSIRNTPFAMLHSRRAHRTLKNFASAHSDSNMCSVCCILCALRQGLCRKAADEGFQNLSRVSITLPII